MGIVEELMPNLYVLRIPMPGPLRAINSYLLRGSQGWALVDAGYHTPETVQAWRDAFQELGIAKGAVEGVVVTHCHPDHFGAAGWLQLETGAPVFMLDREVEVAARLWNVETGRGILDAFAEEGLPAELVDQAAIFQRQQLRRTLPHPQVTPLADGQQLSLGGRQWQVQWSPGHSDGLMVLWCDRDRLLLAGDMVLPKITPNIQWLPRFHPNPLAQFLASLAEIGRLPARVTLPGHRQPIHNLKERTEQIQRHHEERLQLVRELVARGALNNDHGGVTAWEVCKGLFGELPDIHNVRFGIAETLSHLHFLRSLEIVIREEPGFAGKSTASWRLR